MHVAWTQQPLGETMYEIFYRRGTVYTNVEETIYEDELQIGLVIYPSVFSHAVSIQTHTDATITIYDISGQRVRSFSLVDNRVVRWDATDDFGRRLPAGVYIVQATTGKTSTTQKIVYLE